MPAHAAAAPASSEADNTRRLRLYRLLFLGIAAVILLALVWILVTGLLARSRLQAADDDLPHLRQAISAGNLTEARVLADRIDSRARSAHSLTSGPAWWTVANLPLVGEPLRTTRELTRQTHRVSAYAPPLLTDVDRLINGHRAGRTIDPGDIRALAAGVNAATSATARATDAVSGSSPSWFPAVGHARRQLLTSMRTLDGELSGANRATSVLAPLLGADTPQRYFIGFMNEAESRGLGGLPGAYAILTVDRGQFHFTHFGNDVELKHVRTGLDLGAEFNARYAQDDPANFYLNSDVSPDFSDAGRIWAAMWQRKSGQRVDGAIVIDPTALSYLLAATGPAELKDGTKVGASNVVALTEKDQYSKFADDETRNTFLNTISAAVSTKIVAAAGRPQSLVPALRRAIRERRLALWSADPAVQAKIVGAKVGAVVQPSDAYAGFTVINAAGNKLDYYLDRRMTYTRSTCAAGATATASLVLTNDAPRSGLPAYVTNRSDQHPRDVKPGDNRLLVTYYGSTGASITAVTMDGKAQAVATMTEHGLVTTSIDLELPVQATRRITVSITEPRATHALETLAQPLVRPIQIEHSGPTCSAD